MGCCKTLAGITRDCEKGVGGIRRVWIACADDVTTKTITNDQITAISAASGAFKLFEFNKQSGSLTTTPNVDTAAGTVFYQTDLVMQFLKQDTPKRLEFHALMTGDNVAIVEDNNGKYWYLGNDWEVEGTDGSIETGTAFADFNGYNVTISDFSKEPPYEVTQAAIDSITGTGANP